MEIDDISVLVVGAAAASEGARRRAGGRDASACCWALAVCVNDNIGVYLMRASNESREKSRENDLAACKTLEASLQASSFGLATSGHTLPDVAVRSISVVQIDSTAERQ